MNELAILAFVGIPLIAVGIGYAAVRLNEYVGASLERRAIEAERADHAEGADEMVPQARG